MYSNDAFGVRFFLSSDPKRPTTVEIVRQRSVENGVGAGSSREKSKGTLRARTREGAKDHFFIFTSASNSE